MKTISIILITLVAFFAVSNTLMATDAQKLDHQAAKSLAMLYKKNPKAKELGQKATAVLVFPEILKGGFIVGAQRGDGVLMRNGKVAGYYNTSAASYGLQAGIQTYGYTLFFMNEKALSYLNKSGGFELGVGPTLVVADKGFANSTSTTTLQKDIYAFIFDQKGLMAGLGLQGTKITKYTPSK